MHARLSGPRVSKDWLSARWPLRLPHQPKKKHRDICCKLLHHRRTEQELCRQGVKQRWAPHRRGAVLGFPFRLISEALSSFSTACQRHINRESETFLSRSRTLETPLPCGERATTPASPHLLTAPRQSPCPERGLAGVQPTRILRREPAAAGMSGTGRTQLFLIARFCFHHVSLSWLGIFGG